VCKGCVLADVVVPSAAPIVKHMQPTVQKKNDAELPKLTPPHSPQYYYKKKYQFRIDQDSTRIDNKKKVNEIVIRNSKLKR
jgi:hypothetical protein